MSDTKILYEVANVLENTTNDAQESIANDPSISTVLKSVITDSAKNIAHATDEQEGSQIKLPGSRNASEIIFQSPSSKVQKSASFKQRPSILDVSSLSDESDNKVWLEPRTGSGSYFPSRPASFVEAVGPGIYGQRSTSISRSITRDFSGARASYSTKNQLEYMTNKDLVNAVQDLQKNTRHFELENMVFQHFIEQHDPTLIEDMDTSLKTAQTIYERASVSSKRLTLTRHSRRESFFLTTSVSSIAAPGVGEKEGPKINITQKTDLILREMDEIDGSWKKLIKKCGTIKHKLKAELEEMSIRESEIQGTMDTFESVFVNGTVEKYTQQKNPADKFTRFMEECFKEYRAITDKLRLRTSSLKVQYHKICNQLMQKKLLGENLQEVDFEQLQIENQRLVEKIDKRNLLLLELKRMNGHANLLLSRTKKNLLKKLDDLKEIQETITFREDLIGKLDDECEKVAVELENTKSEYDKIKTKSENYQVPPIIDYVKKKAELGQLKKNLKVWSRRKQIKDMALIASIREMKIATGRKSPRNSWFEIPDSHDDSNNVSYEFLFERKDKARMRARMKERMRSRRFKDK